MEVDFFKIVLPALVALVTAVITSVIAHYLSTVKLEKQFSENYKVKYFDKQLTAYQLLWKEYAPLSRYYTNDTIFTFGKNDEVILNMSNIDAFCESVSLFIFSEYGLFISKGTREQLFKLRSVLNDLSKNYDYSKIDQIEVKKKINNIVDELYRLTRNDIGVMNLALGLDDKLNK